MIEKKFQPKADPCLPAGRAPLAEKLLFLIPIIFIAIFLFSKSVIASDCTDKCQDVYLTDKDARDKCEENCKKADAYEKIIETKIKQQGILNNQLNYINSQQSENQKTLRETAKGIETLSEKISSLEKDIEQKEKEISNQKKILSGLIQSYYDYDQQGILEIVVLNKNILNPFGQTDYIGQSGTKISDLLEEMKSSQKELFNDQQELQNSLDQSINLKGKLEDEKDKLQLSENQKEILLAQTKAEKERYEKLLSDIENEIYNLESGKSVDYSKVPAAKGGYFNYPVSSVRVTQGYGMTSYAKKGAYGGKPHNGIDYGVSVGNNIFAVKGGKVVGTGNNGKYAYGKWIAIDHGDGLTTLYGHLSSQSVSKGSQVKTGDKIGKSGNTGNSTGPHLHFSVFTSKSFETAQSKYVKGLMIPVGASINPTKYLK
ncbi:MAG TPA: peptidoglycan DD-metalloendopeptidase family protein [Candidatus Moranbacteria bacterium]|nr:peptidoglycan DD-metalloendopeptidase family protein [Candidatus Moranbacteria bacterium]